MMQPLSDISHEVDLALKLVGGVSLALLIGVTATMVFFVVKYHRSRAHTTAQIKSNFWLELFLIGAPTLIVIWMFFVGYHGFIFIRNPPPGAMVIKVTGRQWAWSFHYPEHDVGSTEMVVPVNTPVKAELTSPANDVIHSFFIPDFRVKEDALPGKTTYLWFEAKREGDFNIFCAEFCGKDHSKMLSMLHVVSAEAFEDWIAEQIRKKFISLEFDGFADLEYETFGELNIDADALYANYCASCHGAKGDGSGLPGVARDFTQLDEWSKSPKVADIYQTVLEGVPGTQMRAFPDFTSWEIVALAHKVRSLTGKPVPTDTQEDYDTLIAKYKLNEVQGPRETIPIERALELLAEEAREANP